MKGKLFIITGPSGVGKTTIFYDLLKKDPSLKRLVNYTSRPMRDGETNGVSYNFTSKDAFKQLIENGEMFEWDQHYGHYYGVRKTDLEDLLETGHNVALTVDVNGAKTFQKKMSEAIIIFITAESEEILFKRLEQREKGREKSIEVRKKALQKEMAFSKTCDHIVINKQGQLADTVNEVFEVIQKA